MAYATELKHALLGVDAGLLAREGAVHPEVARQMADGVRRALGTTWGVATTGVAGPDPQDGRPPGRVFVAVTGPSTSLVEPLQLDGDRAAVRAATVGVALDLLARALAGVRSAEGVAASRAEQRGCAVSCVSVTKDASPARLSGPRGTVGSTHPFEALTPPAGRLQGSPKGTETSRVSVKGGRPVVILRQEIGDVLRDARRQQGRTLREVSSVARVSLGYLSEVERGQKEASSELLASICGALDVPLSSVLHTVSRRVAEAEHVEPEDLDVEVQVPDTVPDGLAGGVALRDGLVSAA